VVTDLVLFVWHLFEGFLMGAMVTGFIPVALYVVYIFFAVFTGRLRLLSSAALQGRTPLKVGFVLGPVIASFMALAGLSEAVDPTAPPTLTWTPLMAVACLAGSLTPGMIYIWIRRHAIIARAERVEATRSRSQPPRSLAGAGWFPDPWQLGRQRWFDGIRWTHHTSP
jgi:hypothetical protein